MHCYWQTSRATCAALCGCVLVAILSTFLSQAVGTAPTGPSVAMERQPTSHQTRQLYDSLSRLFTGKSHGARERTPTSGEFQFGNRQLNWVTRRGCWVTQHETLLVPVYRTFRRGSTRCYKPRFSGQRRCNTTYKYHRQLTHWRREQTSRMVCCPGWKTTPGEDTCSTRVEELPPPSPTPPTESPLEQELAQLKRDYHNLKLMLDLERQDVLKIQSELASEQSERMNLRVKLEECRNATARHSGVLLSGSISNSNPCLGRSCPGHPTAICATDGDCCGGQESIFWLDENGETVECGLDIAATAGVSSLVA